MIVFRRKPPKVIVKLTSEEVRLLLIALVSFRNKVAKEGKPTEDINDLILMVAQ